MSVLLLEPLPDHPLQLPVLLVVITLTDIFILLFYRILLNGKQSEEQHRSLQCSLPASLNLVGRQQRLRFHCCIPLPKNVWVLSLTPNTCSASSSAFCDNLWKGSPEYKLESFFCLFPTSSAKKCKRGERAKIH